MRSVTQIASILSAAYLLSHANAECDLTAGDTTIVGVPLAAGTVVSDEALCMGQGPDSFTFAMIASMSSLGIPAGTGGGDASSQAGWGFAILDNTCKVTEAYSRPGSCGIPYSIRPNDKNGLKYELNIDAMDGGIGAGYFNFKYANGKYTIGNNGCQCADMDSPGNTAVQGCRCAFPINGEPAKKMVREVFNA